MKNSTENFNNSERKKSIVRNSNSLIKCVYIVPSGTSSSDGRHEGLSSAMVKSVQNRGFNCFKSRRMFLTVCLAENKELIIILLKLSEQKFISWSQLTMGSQLELDK